MAIHAIIVAAGTGTRFGGQTPKQLVDLRGQPVLSWSLRAFTGAGIDTIVVVAAAEHQRMTSHVVRTHAPTASITGGGATRSASVRRGLEALDATDNDAVLIHDAARPLVTTRLVTAVSTALRGSDAVTLAVPAADTLIHSAGDVMGDVLDRSTVRRIQTPQGFRYGVIAEAHRRAENAGDDTATDDAGLVRRYLGIEVALVPGSDDNLKITTAGDLAVADALIARRLGSEEPQLG